MLSLEVGGVDGAHVGHDQHVGQRVFRLADGLNHAAGAYGSLNFSHDGIGNRTQLAPDNPDPEDIKTYNYQQWTHHLAGEAEHDRYTAHEYDWAGQLLGRATNVDDGNGGSITFDQKDFSYDALGRLQFYLKNTASPYDPAVSGPTDEIDAPAPSSYRYSYNALDQRVVKERVANNNVYGNGQASRVYFYDLQGHLIAEMEPSTGVIVAETVWLGDQPITHYTRPTDAPLLEQGTIASPSNGLKPYSIHSDHLSTPQVLTDAQGTIAWQATYEPYGKTTSVTGNGANGLASIVFNLRLPGQYFDAESGLHQNWMRDYDPTLGRYIQSDPIGLAGGISTYTYVGGNPLSFTDPMGLIEGSSNNIARRQAIDRIARSYSGSSLWAFSKAKDDFGANKNKCNKFVFDVLKEAGADAYYKARGGKARPPTAGDWAEPFTKIPNWRPLKSNESPQPGDVAAYPLTSSDSSYFGHTGLITSCECEAGGTSNISAHEFSVYGDSSQFVDEKKLLFRRYTGE